MCSKNSNRIGAFVAIAVGVAVAIISANQARAEDRVVVERSGAEQGASVVYIPGLATPGAVYGPTVERHSDWDNHVVTLKGFGGDTQAPEELDNVVEGAALDIAAYLESENLQDVVLVGHSMGAQVALLTAGAAADRVSHVVVVDSAPSSQADAAGRNPGHDGAASAAMRQQMSAMPRDAYLGMMAQGLRVQSMTQDGQAQVMRWIEGADQATVATATAELMSTDFAPWLAEVEAPVTLLYAEFPEMRPSRSAPCSSVSMRARSILKRAVSRLTPFHHARPA